MIRANYDNSFIKELEDDKKSVFLLADGTVRATLCSTTHIVNQMRANFKTGLLETYVLGQAYIAGALLTSCVKGDDRISLQVECGGPIRGLTVEAWACGGVRGYLLENPIKLTKELTSLDTSDLYGPGFLSIIKVLEGSKEPVKGTSMLEYGNLAKDLAVYFKESEQTPSLFYLSLDFDKLGNVVGAGGLFLQALPGCSDETLSALQVKADKLPNLAKAIANKTSDIDYMNEAFSEFNPKLLEDSFIAFSCPCTRENFMSYASSLPDGEKEEILKGAFPLEFECFNCGSIHSFTKSEMETLFNQGEKR